MLVRTGKSKGKTRVLIACRTTIIYCQNLKRSYVELCFCRKKVKKFLKGGFNANAHYIFRFSFIKWHFFSRHCKQKFILASMTPIKNRHCEIQTTLKLEALNFAAAHGCMLHAC